MGELLSKLLKQGLVERTPDPHDQRKTLWKLTPIGEERVESARKTIQKVGQKLDRFFETNGVSKKEIKRMTEILKLVKKEFS